jgi:hypothetical protein
MNLQSMLLLAACAAAWAAMPVAAATYKWLDENGRVVYGDTPPPGVKAERLNAALPPADPNAVRDMAAKDAEFRKNAQARVDEEAKAEKDRADANLRRSQCQQALGQMKSLREGGNVYRFDEKGEKVPLDAAARESAIAQNQKIMRDIGCTPAINAPAGPSTTPTY